MIALGNNFFLVQSKQVGRTLQKEPSLAILIPLGTPSRGKQQTIDHQKEKHQEPNQREIC